MSSHCLRLILTGTSAYKLKKPTTLQKHIKLHLSQCFNPRYTLSAKKKAMQFALLREKNYILFRKGYSVPVNPTEYTVQKKNIRTIFAKYSWAKDRCIVKTEVSIEIAGIKFAFYCVKNYFALKSLLYR